MPEFTLRINTGQNNEIWWDYHLVFFLFKCLEFFKVCVCSIFEYSKKFYRFLIRVVKNKKQKNKIDANGNSQKTVKQKVGNYSSYKKLDSFSTIEQAKARLEQPIENQQYKYL